MSQNLASLSASGASTTCIHAPSARTAASPRRQAFDSEAIQRLYESDDYPMQRPRIEADIWVDVAAALT
jgi:hypothetical protein